MDSWTVPTQKNTTRPEVEKAAYGPARAVPLGVISKEIVFGRAGKKYETWWQTKRLPE